MFEKTLLNKIWLEKYKFYKQLPRKIKYKIEDAWSYSKRTSENKCITVNWHNSEWRENEFNRLLKTFHLLTNNKND